MRFDIQGIFPVPVFITKLDTPVSEDEKELLASFELRPNQVNASSIEQYVLDHPKLQNLKATLSRCVDSYFEEIYKPRPSRDMKAYITCSWTNVVLDSQHHHHHMHPNSFISGVLYVSTAPGDSIEFTNPNLASVNVWDIASDIDCKEFIARHWTFPVEDNMIVLFPSWLTHSVPTRKNNGNPPRLSVPFNTFLKGHIGDEGYVTDLKI